MTREETIEILEKHMKLDCGFCHICGTDYDTLKVAINTAIEALQRDIPKNPIINYVADSDGARRLNDGWTDDSYLCPVCHTYFGTVFNEGYCRKCGQKLIQKRVRVIEK